MTKSKQFFVFRLDDRRYGIPLSSVDRVISAVEITPVPGAADTVKGIINVRGHVLPIVDIRKIFRLGEREIDIDDCILIARIRKRLFGLVIDSVVGVIDADENEILSADNIVPGTEFITDIVKHEGGMVLVNDLDKCLSEDDMQQFDIVVM